VVDHGVCVSGSGINNTDDGISSGSCGPGFWSSDGSDSPFHVLFTSWEFSHIDDLIVDGDDTIFKDLGDF